MSAVRPFLLALLAVSSLAQSAAPSALVQARHAYNDGRFDDAIALAEQAQREPGDADSARVVMARAYLERFRAATDASDLDRARGSLREVVVDRLDPETHVEYLIGVGEALYLNDPPEYAAAAEVFETALARAERAAPAQREVVFDWWAGTLERLAEFGPESERRQVFERMLAGATRHRDTVDTSGVVWYWLAVAARGVGDVERAWGTAVAGWVRAGALGASGAQLRRDLDQLVVHAILPERAARLSPADPAAALIALQAQWDAVKARWSGTRP